MTATRVINQRLRGYLEGMAGVWLIALPLLRPVIWNGDPLDIPNLFYLTLLAAALATGLLLRAAAADTTPRPRSWGLWLGGCFCAWAAWGCLRSPVPAQAWVLWIGWMLHIAAPLALWSEIRRRPQLLFAGLLAGLGLELFAMMGQVLWERPALQHDLALDPNIIPQESMRDQYIVRVYSWRLEGTFLLANTLAAFLITLWPLLADVVIQQWRQRAQRTQLSMLYAGIIVTATTVGVLMTGSKAGILAWMLSLGVAVAYCRPRLQWITTFIITVIIAGILTIPAVRAKAAGSLTERLGYWQGALELTAEHPLTGGGLESFSVDFPRVKAPATEPTIIVHNEILQAACDLGVIGAGLLLGWLGWLVVSLLRRPQDPLLISSSPSSRVSSDPWPWVAMSACVIAGVAMGVMNPNLRSYPGGADFWWLWVMVYACAAGVFVRIGLQLPLPSTTATGIGILACCLHAQADFHLHSMQVVGVLAWVVALGFTRREAAEHLVAVSAARETGYACAGLGAVLLSLGLMAWGHQRAEEKSHAQGVIESLRRVQLWHDRHEDTLRTDAIERVNLALDKDGLPLVSADESAPHLAPQVAELGVAAMNNVLQASQRWPADVELARLASDLASLIHQLRPDLIPTLTPTMRALVEQWPHQPFAVQGIAWHLQKIAEKDTAQRNTLLHEAQEWLRKAVALSPGYLPTREQLVELSRQLGDQATIDEQIAELHRLAPLVHETGRATKAW